MTNVVVFDSEISPERSANKNEFYHVIAERFGIEKNEYVAFLPKKLDDEVSDIRPSDFRENSPKAAPFDSGYSFQTYNKPASDGVPPEY